jgi:hypothetical protein
MPPKPTGPPSDAALTKKLVGRIKAKCADLLVGQSLEVSFIVLAEGKLTALGATPKGPAAQCAVEQVKGTAFRKRTGPTPIDLVVK